MIAGRQEFNLSGISRRKPLNSHPSGHFVRTIGIPAAVDPPVSLFASDAVIKSHADYRSAKAGDVDSAIRLVGDLAPPLLDNLDRFSSNVVFVAPHAEEASGDNAIPQTLATYLSLRTGARCDIGIVQTNKVFHTGADPMQRLIAQSSFTGFVEPGARYVMVDDVTAMGGTLADLANYIQVNGGLIVGVVVLVNAARSGNLVPSRARTTDLERRYGDEIRQTLSVDPEALSAEEAGYLIGFRSADELRNRATKAAKDRDRRLRTKGILPNATSGVTRDQD